MVLFASYSGSLGGAERLLLDWVTAIDGERCLACPEGALADAARVSAVRVFPVRARSLELRRAPYERVLASARLAAHARDLHRLAANLDPELVVAWGMRSAIALMLGRHAGRRWPVAFQHNDLLPGPLVGAVVRAAAARGHRDRPLAGRRLRSRPSWDVGREGPCRAPGNRPRPLRA